MKRPIDGVKPVLEMRGELWMVLTRLETNPRSVQEWNAIVDALTSTLEAAKSHRLGNAPSPDPGESTRDWLRRVGVR